jgi:amino acid permease
MKNLQVYLNTWIGYVVLVIIVLIVFIMIRKEQQKELRTDGDQVSADGNGRLFYLGRGSSDDDISTLLQRTYWSAYLQNRTETWQRVFMISMFSVIMIILLVRRELPSVTEIVLTGVVIFFCVYMLTTFMYVHGDIYNDANIRSNVSLIASKLRLKVDLKEKPPKPTSGPPDRLEVM